MKVTTMLSRCPTTLWIRAETPGDWAAIDDVHDQAFGRESESRLVRELRATHGFSPDLSLIALRDGSVVGHILFSRVDIVMANDPIQVLALAPMAVLPDYQRRGIGSQLVRTGLDVCRAGGHQAVIVVGNPGLCGRFGFRPAAALGLENSLGIQADAFMAMELVPEALDDVSGMVIYPPAFSAV